MLWLKAFHIIFVVCWFAGLFYLPRILVNYAACEDAATRDQLAGMARRLYRFVTPFMYLSFGFGLAMLWMNWAYYLSAPWMWLKLAGVIVVFAHPERIKFFQDDIRRYEEVVRLGAFDLD